MKILLAIDDSDDSSYATQLVKNLPLPSDSEISVLNVLEPYDTEIGGGEARTVIEEYRAACVERSSELLAEAEKTFADKGWNVTTFCRVGDISDTVIAEATKIDADVVVLGCRGNGPVRRFLLGSVSDYVLKHAPCSVLIVRPQAAESKPPFRVVLCSDGSPWSEAARDWLTSLDWGDQTSILALRVQPPLNDFGLDVAVEQGKQWHRLKDEAEKETNAVVESLRKVAPASEGDVRYGVDGVAEEILRVAEEKQTDLVVLGHKGKSALERFFIGSVSYRVALHAPCSVLVVR